MLNQSISELNERLAAVEARFHETGYSVKEMVTSEIRNRWTPPYQAETMFGLVTALCCGTIDPWKQNAVTYFTPFLHEPDTDVDALPFAYPISSMGGFDDCGLNWVPPAGSTLCLIFEGGHRDSAFYIGTTWHRDRGPDGQHNWGFNIQEYYNIHEGHRKGYIIGANDGSQVLPQWNTESYNGIDIDSIADFDDNPNAQKRITYPNIYGFKTPQKHMIKMVDGDYKCSQKNKRFEILSSCGNWMIFKDDHLHQFNPQTGDSCPPNSTDGGTDENTSCVSGGTAGTDYFKHKNELRPWNGPGTPQNNKCGLNQSGIQLLSISGHSFLMDDSVEEPTGIPNWERSIASFDFGCTNLFQGRIALISATGHTITLNDEETSTNIRSENNGIDISTACGNEIFLCDDSISETAAGNNRGITITSTSNHTITLNDSQNNQAAPARMAGGTPVAKAKNAYIKIRSGYGLEINMNDGSDQTTTIDQSITITSPQTDNITRGPHVLRFQEAASGPGQVFLIVGGSYLLSVYDDSVEYVGSTANPSDKIASISGNYFVESKQVNYNKAGTQFIQSDTTGAFLAGKDYPQTGSNELGPGYFPVLCMGDNGILISDRIFVSASPTAQTASIYQLQPFAGTAG